MTAVVLSELAEADLTDIWVFVARDNAEAADRLVLRALVWVGVLYLVTHHPAICVNVDPHKRVAAYAGPPERPRIPHLKAFGFGEIASLLTDPSIENDILHIRRLRIQESNLHLLIGRTALYVPKLQQAIIAAAPRADSILDVWHSLRWRAWMVDYLNLKVWKVFCMAGIDAETLRTDTNTSTIIIIV